MNKPPPAPPVADSAGTEPRARWSIEGPARIVWTVRAGEAHRDHVEMSGRHVSVIVTYGVDDSGHFTTSHQVVWPMLRFQPNRTRDHLSLDFGEDARPRILLDQIPCRDERVSRVVFDGLLRIEGTLGPPGAMAFTRTIFPSVDEAAVIDRTVLTNRSTRDMVIEIEDNQRVVHTDPARGIYGGYTARAGIAGAGVRCLRPGESSGFALWFTAQKAGESALALDPAAEEAQRRASISGYLDRLQLETPDAILNTAFALAKIRATESIFATKGGLMHSPGGGAYYAAMWANDQAEYASPYFACLGDPAGTEASLNCFRHFARYMNPGYEPIPSAINAEGAGYWHGAKDRGDMAMLAYGAARFALTLGVESAARELWPLIEWCLEYCHRKLTPAGVVASDSDELENRFPAGEANLCTSSLYYDALCSAAALCRELEEPSGKLEAYADRAQLLRTAIERHFGAVVEGFATYRYFEGNTVLRSWICIPLTVDVFERSEGTLQALFSPRLLSADGLVTQAGDHTFWDRTTLYALRGAFAAGATEPALSHLLHYSSRRLLGDHVPYPVEAYPEGNQRHLSAESALYCRVFTEGLFGLRPTGFRSFTCRPRLPPAWGSMELKNVHAFGTIFDLTVARKGENLQITVARGSPSQIIRMVAPGENLTVDFSSMY